MNALVRQRLASWTAAAMGPSALARGLPVSAIVEFTRGGEGNSFSSQQHQ